MDAKNQVVTRNVLEEVVSATMNTVTSDIGAQISDFATQVNKRFDQVDGRLDKLEIGQRELRRDVDTLKQDVAVLKRDVSLLQRDMSEVKQRLDYLEGEKRAVWADYKELSKRLERIEKKVDIFDRLKPAQRLATKKDVAQLQRWALAIGDKVGVPFRVVPKT